jgi:hypothetical protein
MHIDYLNPYLLLICQGKDDNDGIYVHNELTFSLRELPELEQRKRERKRAVVWTEKKLSQFHRFYHRFLIIIRYFKNIII